MSDSTSTGAPDPSGRHRPEPMADVSSGEPFQRILVPLDGSRFSELALPMANGLASRLGASIHLVTVSPGGAGGMSGLDPGTPAVEAADETAVRDAERYLREAVERIRGAHPDLRVSSRVVTGGPVVAALREETARWGADLVVMTTHGRGGIQRAWFGSVAEGTVRTAERPVLLVRPVRGEDEEEEDPGADPLERAHEPFRRVLVPLDGSQAAEEALDLARGVVQAHGATLILLRVAHPVVRSTYPFRTVPAHPEPDDGEAKRRAQSYLETLARAFRDGGMEVETVVPVSHHPALEILGHARETDVDLVAMTTRGYGAAGRVLLGSVADKVIRGSEAPVLVQRTAAEEE